MSNKQLKELLIQVDQQVEQVQSAKDWDQVFNSLRQYPHALSFNYQIHLSAFFLGVALLLWVSIQKLSIFEFPQVLGLIAGSLLVLVPGIMMMHTSSIINSVSRKIFYKDLRIDYGLKSISQKRTWFNKYRFIFKELMYGEHSQEITSLYGGTIPKTGSEYQIFKFEYATTHTQLVYNVALKMHTTQTTTEHSSRFGLVCSLRTIPEKEDFKIVDELFNKLNLKNLTIECKGGILFLAFDNDLLHPALPCLLSNLDKFERAVKAPSEVEQLEKIFNLIWLLES